MLWVVLSHNFSERLTKTKEVLDTEFLTTTKNDWLVSFIEHGFYAVDFFLFMGGFVAIVSLRRIILDFKDSAPWKLPFLYVFLLVKRYARLLPLVAVLNWWKYGVNEMVPLW